MSPHRGVVKSPIGACQRPHRGEMVSPVALAGPIGKVVGPKGSLEVLTGER